jgi:glycosyltransferase involved in cell wall biosynthesis
VADPLVTVAMSVHNGAGTLKSAVHSILWQTFSDWELLIVNDASTDASSQICHQFHDSRIRVVDESQQRGLAVRLNQCVEQARGKYVARMDADDIAYPERFERQVHYLESHPDIDLLGHGAVVFKGEGEIIGLYPVAQRHEDICRRPWWGFPLAHPTWMGKRVWFARHRYHQEVKKGQDQELLLRAWQTSRFATLSDCLLGYRMDKVSSAKSAVGRAHYCRTLFSQAHDLKSVELLIRGVFVHGLGLIRDTALELMPISGRKIRQSLGSANPPVVEEWNKVWGKLQETSRP